MCLNLELRTTLTVLGTYVDYGMRKWEAWESTWEVEPVEEVRAGFSSDLWETVGDAAVVVVVVVAATGVGAGDTAEVELDEVVVLASSQNL